MKTAIRKPICRVWIAIVILAMLFTLISVVPARAASAPSISINGVETYKSGKSTIGIRANPNGYRMLAVQDGNGKAMKSFPNKGYKSTIDLSFSGLTPGSTYKFRIKYLSSTGKALYTSYTSVTPHKIVGTGNVTVKRNKNKLTVSVVTGTSAAVDNTTMHISYKQGNKSYSKTWTYSQSNTRLQNKKLSHTFDLAKNAKVSNLYVYMTTTKGSTYTSESKDRGPYSAN